MKKNSRSLALLLAFFLLIGSVGCSPSMPEETTSAEAASTTAPETTEIITEETTADSTQVVEIPETSAPETSAPDTTAPETEPPKAKDTLRIIMKDGTTEAILSELAEEKYQSLLSAREKALLYDHAAQIELSKTENLKNIVQNQVLAADIRYDLILTDPLTGIELVNTGLLENLNTAGISITPDSIGVGSSITKSLAIGENIYLVASNALVSDLSATYAIRYKGTALSSDPVEKALAGEFTAEIMLTYITENVNVFSMASVSPIDLFKGLGGEIFVKDEKGVLSSSVKSGTSFSDAYTSTLGIYSKSTKNSAIFTLEKLSPLEKGETWLPIPKANQDSTYSSPIDHTSIYLFAAPIGIISGNRLNSLVTAFASSSNDYREAVKTEIIGQGNKKAAELLGVIENCGKLDFGNLFSWGDIGEYIENGLQNNRSADDILADRMTEMRNKAADTAASIFAEKLGIN